MQSLEFKKHKRFIKLFKNILQSNINLFVISTGILGFSLDVRGKLGVTGNAKKRHLAFTIGRISITSKNTRLMYNHNLIQTETGVLGVTYFLMY